MSRRDAHGLLLRALHQRAGGPELASIADASSEAWASATFHGARHKLVLHFSGEDAAARADRLAGEMDAIEFSLPGHLVADIAVTARQDQPEGIFLSVEALTVEEA